MGTLTNLRMFDKLQEVAFLVGLKECKMRHMGGDLVLILEVPEDSMKNMLDKVMKGFWLCFM